jgi:hypothetical protein
MTKGTNEGKVKKNQRFQRHCKTKAHALHASSLTAVDRDPHNRWNLIADFLWNFMRKKASF